MLAKKFYVIQHSPKPIRILQNDRRNKHLYYIIMLSVLQETRGSRYKELYRVRTIGPHYRSGDCRKSITTHGIL